MPRHLLCAHASQPAYGIVSIMKSIFRPLAALLLGLIFLPGFTPSSKAKGKAEHVVMIVWDGMRPDFITPQYTPTLYGLATNGVFFKHHHAAYISSTEVNGTALATGVHPSRSGIMANTEYWPEMGWLSTFGTEHLDAVRRGDFLSDGRYLNVPTIADILHQAGIPTVIAGTKPVVLLHDRAWNRTSQAAKDSALIFEGKAVPRTLGDSLKKLNDDKAFPTTVTYPNTAQDTWTTKSLIEGLWKKEVPKFSVLWLSEPDKSQHETGVASDTSIAAIDGSDQRLADVIKALDRRKVLAKTDIIVVSDHGFSTINRGPDVADILKRRGFNASKKFENPEPGDVMVVGLGGSVSLYVVERQESVIQRLVDFLQTSDFAGVIFSRLPIEGTFPLETTRIGTANYPPDIVVSLRWSADPNERGAPGLITSADGTKGKGHHASLSRFDMHNTLVASGPDFKRGLASETPSGNIDVVPTILWLLGVRSTNTFDGRILHEALAGSKEPPATATERRIEATRDTGFFRWHQYLRFTEVGKSVYFDEGNGRPTLK